MANRVVMVDLDGTLAEYHGWSEKIGPPIPGAQNFLRSLQRRGYEVVIFSARLPLDAISIWLARHGFPNGLEVTNMKLPAHAYIDDRAIPFNGDYREALAHLQRFEPWWQPQGEVPLHARG